MGPRQPGHSGGSEAGSSGRHVSCRSMGRWTRMPISCAGRTFITPRPRLIEPRRWTMRLPATFGAADDPMHGRRSALCDRMLQPRQRLWIDDRDTMRLATLQVIVPIRNAQMADPELASALALFRRAANVIARLEDAVVFRGLTPTPTQHGGAFVPGGRAHRFAAIWQITGALQARGIWRRGPGQTDR